jgi:predicted Fe-Mo cluster-binding NifX family protein
MSIKVAIATSDERNIDLHFGQASQFALYELRGDHFEFLENRKAPKTEVPQADEAASFSGGAGCGGGFCGGCGSGCGGSCGGGAGGPVSPVVESLLDCRAIVVAQIGQNVRRQFERNAVSVFDIELPIEEALAKLASYYLKFEA